MRWVVVSGFPLDSPLFMPIAPRHRDSGVPMFIMDISFATVPGLHPMLLIEAYVG